MSETATLIVFLVASAAGIVVLVAAGAKLEADTHLVQMRRWRRAHGGAEEAAPVETTPRTLRLRCIEGGRVSELSRRGRGGLL